MCLRNNNGEHPSCLESKFAGPGCEDWDLCPRCADTLHDQLREAQLKIEALEKALAEEREECARAVGSPFCACTAEDLHDGCCGSCNVRSAAAIRARGSTKK